MQATMPGNLFTITLTDGTAVQKPMGGYPIPLTVWVEPAVGDTITVSYSVDSEVTYKTLVATTTSWEVRFDSGITHIKFQRTAGAGTTSTCGVC